MRWATWMTTTTVCVTACADHIPGRRLTSPARSSTRAPRSPGSRRWFRAEYASVIHARGTVPACTAMRRRSSLAPASAPVAASVGRPVEMAADTWSRIALVELPSSVASGASGKADWAIRHGWCRRAAPRRGQTICSLLPRPCASWTANGSCSTFDSRRTTAATRCPADPSRACATMSCTANPRPVPANSGSKSTRSRMIRIGRDADGLRRPAARCHHAHVGRAAVARGGDMSGKQAPWQWPGIWRSCSTSTSRTRRTCAVVAAVADGVRRQRRGRWRASCVSSRLAPIWSEHLRSAGFWMDLNVNSEDRVLASSAQQPARIPFRNGSAGITHRAPRVWRSTTLGIALRARCCAGLTVLVCENQRLSSFRLTACTDRTLRIGFQPSRPARSRHACRLNRGTAVWRHAGRGCCRAGARWQFWDHARRADFRLRSGLQATARRY